MTIYKVTGHGFDYEEYYLNKEKAQKTVEQFNNEANAYGDHDYLTYKAVEVKE